MSNAIFRGGAVSPLPFGVLLPLSPFLELRQLRIGKPLWRWAADGHFSSVREPVWASRSPKAPGDGRAGRMVHWQSSWVFRCENPNRTPSLISIISLWQTSFNPLGLVVSQPAMNFGLLCTKKGEILCLFQKNISVDLVAKEGKGRTPFKGFQEKPA